VLLCACYCYHCQVFDKNSDGYIDEQELQLTMKELGVTLTSDDVTAMFTEAGCKDQRRITYEGSSSLIPFLLSFFGCYLAPGKEEDFVKTTI